MKASLRPGVSCVNRLKVDQGRTIDFMGEAGRVYSTPNLVRDIEMTCRQLLLEHCDTGEDSVGTDIAVKHMAPTPLGMTVEIAATMTALDGRKATFDIIAKDEADQICVGTHGRFVVDTRKTIERLKAKAAKLSGAKPG